MEEITEIPKIPEDIKDAARKGHLVIFIGAGVSRIVGCPSWNEFALIYLKYIKDNGLIDYLEYEQLLSLGAKKIISICKKIIKKNGIPLPDIKENLKPDGKLLKKNKVYKSLYDINAIYITTNYDEILDKIACNRVEKMEFGENESDHSRPERTPINKECKIIYNYDDLLISNLNNGNVIHIHGSVNDQDKIISTLVEYIKHYERDSKPEYLLKEVFKKYTVLFIGYGLEELEIIEYLIQKQVSTNKTVIQHYILQPFFSNQINLCELQKHYYSDMGVRIIPYTIDKNGYEQLSNVIQAWASQLGQISKPKNYFDKIREIDEVL